MRIISKFTKFNLLGPVSGKFQKVVKMSFFEKMAENAPNGIFLRDKYKSYFCQFISVCVHFFSKYALIENIKSKTKTGMKKYIFFYKIIELLSGDKNEENLTLPDPPPHNRVKQAV